MDRWALITGASSGIGLELARQFAAGRWNLVLLARNEPRLNEVAAELGRDHGVQTRLLVQDLTIPSAPDEVFESLRDLPVSALVNNAGVGFFGPFAESDLREQSAIVEVNIVALVRLTRLFLEPMIARRSGRILNVASTAAFQPGPTIAVYYASKAFVHSFSYALSLELERTGVTVTALYPGTTRTQFFSRGHFGRIHAPFSMDARAVAAAGYRGMIRGRRVVIPGLLNRTLTALARVAPDRWSANAVRRIHQSR